MSEIDFYFTNVHEWDIEFLKSYLSDDELMILKPITHQLTLQQKIVNRALLKLLFFKNYAIQWDQIAFLYNDRGKPSLTNQPSLYFNCSHAKDFVLIGITKKGPLGVDIEAIQKNIDEDGIAQTFFNVDEYEEYTKFKINNKTAFYHFWTAKEALIKSLGKGLWEKENLPKLCVKDGQIIVMENSYDQNRQNISFINVHKDYVACFAVNAAVSNYQVQYLENSFLNECKVS